MSVSFNFEALRVSFIIMLNESLKMKLSSINFKSSEETFNILFPKTEQETFLNTFEKYEYEHVVNSLDEAISFFMNHPAFDENVKVFEVSHTSKINNPTFHKIDTTHVKASFKKVLSLKELKESKICKVCGPEITGPSTKGYSLNWPLISEANTIINAEKKINTYLKLIKTNELTFTEIYAYSRKPFYKKSSTGNKRYETFYKKYHTTYNDKVTEVKKLNEAYFKSARVEEDILNFCIEQQLTFLKNNSEKLPFSKSSKENLFQTVHMLEKDLRKNTQKVIFIKNSSNYERFGKIKVGGEIKITICFKLVLKFILRRKHLF